ncbi:MAG: hypothetical protein ING65_15410 [Rhodocyclaceae bacterium]|nr:hypothetical protein [Rhodocyclaceae bacterium]
MTLRLSEGQVVAWELTAAILAAVDRDELELLPEIMTSVHAPAGKIDGVPGAWDFDLTSVHSLAIAIFGTAVTCLQAGAPKLFDATIDVGKDATKKIVDRYLQRASKATKEGSDRGPDVAHLHELVRVAALERKLSPANADALANAVVARLTLKNSTSTA